MATKTQVKSRIEQIKRVWTLDSKIYPNENEDLAFAYPSFGPDEYREIGKQILDKGLSIPTGDEIASLLHSAYFSEPKDQPEFENIREIMRNRRLWVFLQELSTDYGFYSINDVSALGRSIDAGKLEKELAKEMRSWKKIKGTSIKVNEDRTIRFVEEGSYARGEVNPKELATDNGVIADYGKEGSEKLAEIAEHSQFPNKPYIHRLKIEKGQAPKLRISALDDCDWLRVDGCDFGADRGGHSFGVLR